MKEKLISIALGEVGYLEKASNKDLENKTANAGSKNYTKYGAWYPMQAQPWCAMFVSWCAEQAGIGTDIIPKHASCTVGVNWFRARGGWHSRIGYKPQAGDIVYFTRNGSTPVHVGIVYKTDDAYLYTVEGNTTAGAELVENGGAVEKKKYPYVSTRILGYGSPAYVKEEEMTQERFNEMVEAYMSERGKKEPGTWSGQARKWAEENGYISGDAAGNKNYRKYLTREEAVQLLYNILGD